MRPTAFLPLALLGSLPGAFSVQLELTETRLLNGSEPRVEIVDIPYVDTSLLPKDQPCYALPFRSSYVKLLMETLTVPTYCYLYTQLCHNALTPVTEDEPEVNPILAGGGAAFAARCYEIE
ncbi:uncharacterized protein DSM5745_05037 [Aspergillus mulundensis]|uniref:Uncharacterized protein n=1 Tax=Aspergillus mulundensis TaxID=1810919 RepID=A0A3D8S5K5_9EURO|nr:hypothetical protein DSM5745_05037 [Aspergillus mulundensis]RDW81480.1 hypothetical protein DSM5745_05037 [Aspergillus mulundensis]